MKRFLLAALLASISTMYFNHKAIAQSEITPFEIMMTGDYKYGEGYAEEREDARMQATQAFIQKIQVLITSETEVVEKEIDEEYTSQYKSNVQTISRMHLRGLNFLDQKRRDNSWRSIAYMSNDDFDNTIKTERRRLHSKVNQALEYESLGDYNRSALLYYEILNDTYSVPVPLYTDSELHGVNIEVREFARDKLYEWLNGLELSVSSVRNRSSQENIECYIDLNITYNNKPAKYIKISINRPGYGWHTVERGSAEIFYDLKPENIHETISFRIAFEFPKTGIDQVRSIVNRTIPPINRTVRVDFSSVINLDFDIQGLSDNRYRFIPKPGILSVSNVEWDFGDGIQTEETNPVHTYLSSNTPKEVTLRFNRNSDLVVRKTIHSSGQVSESKSIEGQGEKRKRTNDDGYYMPMHHKNVVSRISRFTDFVKLQEYLEYLKEVSSLSDWSIYTQELSKPELNRAYIIIINRETERVHAIISPVSDRSRFNLISEPKERLSAVNWEENYRGLGAVWFRFSR